MGNNANRKGHHQLTKPVNRQVNCDITWAQLQHQSDDFLCIQPFAPRPINKRKTSLVRRIFKAMWLCATTNYRLSTAWAVAGV